MSIAALPPAPNMIEPRPVRRGLGRSAAIAGIIAGFLTWIVPGVFALRSYRRWQRGEIARPTFAWVAVVAGPVVWALTFGGLFFLTYGVPLLEDDFSDPRSGWHTAVPPNSAAFVDGGFELVVGSGQVGDVSASGIRWNEGSRPNVAVEADVRLLEGDAFAGVGCVDADREIGYFFGVDSTGQWQIYSAEEGRVLQEGATDVDPARGTRIRGECRGGYGDHVLRMLVDGAPVSTLSVPRSVSDYTGVALVLVATSHDRTRARFDDVVAIAIQPSADMPDG
jgi:hypothetical protein